MNQNNLHHNEKGAQKYGLTTIQPAPSRWKEASTHLLPNDLPSLIASIGVLAGIVYYLSTQNPWLLLTFISFLFGKKVTDQIHHSYSPSCHGISSSSPCDAWGSRIEAILLADLAEEEWQALVEHSHTCSACAELVWRYHSLKEIARQLPYQNLYDQIKNRQCVIVHFSHPLL